MNISSWTNRLRSGRYSQGTDFLYNADDDTYCCLGVACDAIKPKFKERDLEMLRVSAFVVPLHGELADMKRMYPMMEPYLACLNDMGASFNKIADEIDRLWNGDSSNYDYWKDNDGPDILPEIVRRIMK